MMPPALRQRLLTEGRPGALAFVATQTDVLVRWLVLQMVYYAVFMLRVLMLRIHVARIHVVYLCLHTLHVFIFKWQTNVPVQSDCRCIWCMQQIWFEHYFTLKALRYWSDMSL